jgi:hypothetical protein
MAPVGMEERRLRLSSAGFANVRFEGSDNDFEFVVGRCRFPCNNRLACFLSPKIAKLHFLDPTVTCYSVSSIADANIFQSFLSICSGSELIVCPSIQSDFSSLSRELGNAELFWPIENGYPNDSSELSIENAVLRYLAKQSFGGDFDQEVAFITSNFSGVQNIGKLEVSDLEMIISDTSLRISSEDFLFDFICERGFLEHFRLFECVKFCVSADRISHFVEQV